MNATSPQARSRNFFASSEAYFLYGSILLSLGILALGVRFLSFYWQLVEDAALIVINLFLYWSARKSFDKDAELASDASRLNKIIAVLPDGVIVYDRDFKIKVFNPAAERIFNLSAAEAMGLKISPESVQNRKLGRLAQVVFPSLAPLVVPKSEPGAYPQVADISFSDPLMELRVSTSPIVHDDGSTGFIKVVIDRTREAEILKSKSEFITVAAHQLQTPITTAYWALDILRKEESISEENRETAREGFIASQNLSKIVNDLLDVAKIEEGKFGYNIQPADIVSFMAEITKNAHPVAKNAGVNLYFDPGPEHSILLAIDPAKLAMAFSNLIDNAIKYNLKNGSVTVKIERLPGKPFVQISVKDTGIGISAENLPHLFKKFFRADNAVKVHTEGTGLGLYIAKNIVRRHGGRIWAESTLGRGTTFYVTLPTDPKLIPQKEAPYEE